MLTIFYLYKVLCSLPFAIFDYRIVVNCLQFFIFTRFFAVRTLQKVCKTLLWIAYNFLSLQGSLQSPFCHFRLSHCCELLTIFYLYKVLCSKDLAESMQDLVVNCLQFFIFTRFFAVYLRFHLLLLWLWIAYNFLSLQGSLQFICGCNYFLYVVNCLQFFIFTRFFAVRNICLWSQGCCELLTIFYLYKVLCSLIVGAVVGLISCELLTIFYLYKVLCSAGWLFPFPPTVVNCLQFFIFTRFFAVLLVDFPMYWRVVNCLQFFIFTRFFAV